MAKSKWGITEEHLDKLQREGKIRGYTSTKKTAEKKGKRAKYSNNKVEYDGKTFDSKKEYKRYRELQLLEKKHIIAFLRLQVPYELNEGGTHSIKYLADFVYVDVETGKQIVEDVKGFRTDVYEKKKRLMKKIYGIGIKET